jgi:glycosyltransferase involved in cell wall biosynthesis
MRVLLLSAYDAASHRRWREGLVSQFPEHDWEVLALPPRHFSWRIRGNGLSWACAERDTLERDFDRVIATSMVDLATLRGLVPKLATVPAIAYFHENQFAYPASERQFDSIEPQMVNLYTALAAERVVFNSDYNRRTFLDGVAALLAKLPDAVPDGVVDALAGKTIVLPVALEAEVFKASCERASGPLQVIWNHRWEYDKGPDRLLAIVERLLDRSVDFQLSVLGEQFRQVPDAFARLQRRLDTDGNRLRHWGYIDSVDDYRACLAAGDIALSTALHDFQGLSMLEAVAAGCLPLVPDRLSYPEWFAAEFRYASRIETINSEADSAADAIERLAWAKAAGELPAPPSVTKLSWPALHPHYAQLLTEVATR